MNVILEAIKFNHDPNSATTDAFNIRRNETAPVIAPEWQRGISVNPEDSPAAYARDVLKGTSPTIRVKFTFVDFDPAIQIIKIQAVDGDPNQRGGLSNVLGPVPIHDINLGGEEYKLFCLRNARVNSAGVSVSDVIWRWQFSLDSCNWADFAITKHRIYTVL